MTDSSRRSALTTILAIVLALAGIALLVGGAMLLARHGSVYYAIAGAALIVDAWLLWRSDWSMCRWACLMPDRATYDTTTGEELWNARHPAGGQASPMSDWLRTSGRQFALIAAGGSGSLGTPQGDSIVAYALRKR